MPYKKIGDRRAAIRRHYYGNREYYIKKSARRKNNLRKIIYELKASTPCADCKKYYPYYVMDFDHLRDKKGTITDMANHLSYGMLMNEIKKCEIVCSNCHRIRTFSRLKK